MERIFISYDRDDQAVAQSIYDDLLGRPDIDPWLDVKRLKIVRFDPECLKLIEQSSYVLALVSPASVTSTGFVAKEWDHAIAKQRRVLPFLLDAAVEDDPQTAHVLREFDAISWVRGYESLKEGLRKVLREIYGDLAQGTFRETFSSLGPDNIGWRLDGWNLVDEDASEQNSQSLHAEVAPQAEPPRPDANPDPPARKKDKPDSTSPPTNTERARSSASPSSEARISR